MEQLGEIIHKLKKTSEITTVQEYIAFFFWDISEPVGWTRVLVFVLSSKTKSVFSIVDHLNPQNSCTECLTQLAPFKHHGLSCQALTCLQPPLCPTEDIANNEWSVVTQLNVSTSFFNTRILTSLSRFHSSSLFRPNQGRSLQAASFLSLLTWGKHLLVQTK